MIHGLSCNKSRASGGRTGGGWGGCSPPRGPKSLGAEPAQKLVTKKKLDASTRTAARRSLDPDATLATRPHATLARSAAAATARAPDPDAATLAPSGPPLSAGRRRQSAERPTPDAARLLHSPLRRPSGRGRPAARPGAGRPPARLHGRAVHGQHGQPPVARAAARTAASPRA